MTFSDDDPRTALRGGPGTAASAIFAAPALHEFRTADGSGGQAANSWTVRGQNTVLEYNALNAGERLHGLYDPDESVAFTVGDDALVEVQWEGQTTTLTGRAMAVIPPGAHSIVAHSAAHLVRLYTTANAERTATASNAADYRAPHPNVAPLTLWPTPAGEARLRRYQLSDYAPTPGRFGNIFRTRAFMINFISTSTGPKDPMSLSPHTHDDFEQLSLVVDGEYVHHIRTPWTPRRAEWAEDVHWRTAAPSLAIIPPPLVHTSENVGEEANTLIDIFSPPRVDFSGQPGWVLNADDYPPAD